MDQNIKTRLRQNADLDEMEHCNPIVVALEREAADHIEALERQLADLRQAPACSVNYLRANFTPYYILANARRGASAKFKHAPNWVLAMNIFAVGSNSGIAICHEAGIDPDATETRKIAAAPSAGQAKPGDQNWQLREGDQLAAAGEE